MLSPSGKRGIPEAGALAPPAAWLDRLVSTCGSTMSGPREACAIRSGAKKYSILAG
jgi:hypothetical protein